MPFASQHFFKWLGQNENPRADTHTWNFSAFRCGICSIAPDTKAFGGLFNTDDIDALTGFHEIAFLRVRAECATQEKEIKPGEILAWLRC